RRFGIWHAGCGILRNEQPSCRSGAPRSNLIPRRVGEEKVWLYCTRNLRKLRLAHFWKVSHDDETILPYINHFHLKHPVEPRGYSRLRCVVGAANQVRRCIQRCWRSDEPRTPG